MVGIENIPESAEGGALLIFYHGAIPIDYYYILAKIVLLKRRCIRSVGDHFLFKIPGMLSYYNAFSLFAYFIPNYF